MIIFIFIHFIQFCFTQDKQPFNQEPKSLQALAFRYIQNNLSSAMAFKTNDEIDTFKTNVKNGIFDHIMVEKEKYVADASEILKNILKNKPIHKQQGSSYFYGMDFSADGSVGLQREEVGHLLMPYTYKYHLHKQKKSLVVPFDEDMYDICHNQGYVIGLKFINVQYVSLMNYRIATDQLSEMPIHGVHVQNRYDFKKVALDIGRLAIHPTEPLAFRYCKDLLEIHDLENRMITERFSLSKEIQKISRYHPANIEFVHVGPDRIYIKCLDARYRGSHIIFNLQNRQFSMLKNLIIDGKEFGLQEISPDSKSAVWCCEKKFIIADTLTNEIISQLDLSQSKKFLHPLRFINSDLIIFKSSPFQVCWNFKTGTLEEVACSSFVKNRLFDNNCFARPYENYFVVKQLSDIQKTELIRQLETIKPERSIPSLFPKPCLIDFKIDSSKYEFFKSLEKNGKCLQ